MSNAQKPFERLACLIAAAVIGFTGFSVSVVGQPSSQSVLNPEHPETYVVERGDTLWDIAAMFLRDPWYWPEIWQVNQEIENPHLIYPGDVLSLAYVDGRPVIQLERGGGTVERLSPRVRSEPIEQAIPTIPFETLRAFLSRSSLIQKDEFEAAPYILAHEEGLIGSSGRDVYARGTDAPEDTVFNIVHQGKPLVDPDDGDVLGYEGIFVGQGRVRRAGDPSTIYLLDSEREALVGDRLMPEETVVPVDFLPRAPEEPIDGQIMSVVDGISLIGQYQVVAINRGARHGIEPGHVLRAFQAGRVIRDTVSGRGLFGEKVQLPDEPAGTMMVFRTYDRMSYALVMEATRAINVLDSVRSP